MMFLLQFVFASNELEAQKVGVVGSFKAEHPTVIPYEKRTFVEGLLYRYLLQFEPIRGWSCNLCEKLPSLAQIRNLHKNSSRKNPFLLRLRLKQDILWSDKAPVSVDDIIFSWKVFKRFQDEHNPVNPAFIIESISKSTVANELVIKLKDFRVDIFNYLQFPILRESIEESIWFRSIDSGIQEYFSKSKYTTQIDKPGLFIGDVSVNQTDEN